MELLNPELPISLVHRNAASFGAEKARQGPGSSRVELYLSRPHPYCFLPGHDFPLFSLCPQMSPPQPLLTFPPPEAKAKMWKSCKWHGLRKGQGEVIQHQHWEGIKHCWCASQHVHNAQRQHWGGIYWRGLFSWSSLEDHLLNDAQESIVTGAFLYLWILYMWFPLCTFQKQGSIFLPHLRGCMCPSRAYVWLRIIVRRKKKFLWSFSFLGSVKEDRLCVQISIQVCPDSTGYIHVLKIRSQSVI